jgi:type 1 glutamine amidotransferase
VNAAMSKRALIVAGGWDGHQPQAAARFAEQHLLADHEVVTRSDLDLLNVDDLSHFDLIIPIWTFGTLTDAQEAALCEAVESGLGMVAWHSAATSFQGNRRYKHLLGGQVLAHPGGDRLPYQVSFSDDPLTVGLPQLEVTSEQYYLMTDPAVTVVATTITASDEMPWLKGVQMPVAWRRAWGLGRVFYCSLGHSLDVLQQPSVIELLRRAINWAQRSARVSPRA